MIIFKRGYPRFLLKMLREDIEKEILLLLQQEGVENKVSRTLVEDYIICKSRFYECEDKNSEYGIILKNKKGEAEPSPLVEISLCYLKQSYKILEKLECEIRKHKRKLKNGN